MTCYQMFRTLEYLIRQVLSIPSVAFENLKIYIIIETIEFDPEQIGIFYVAFQTW